MISAVVLAVSLSAAPTPKLLSPGVWQRTVVTPSGASLSLHRYVPAVPKTGPAVLLVPELAFSRHSFDVEGFGLAPYLQKRGREVFVLEPRGQGASPARTGDRLEQLALEDVPAAVDAVIALLPKDAQLDLIAHGYGGALAIAAVADRREVRRIIALAVPFEPAVPNASLVEALGGEGGIGDDARRFDFLFAHRTQIPWRRLQRVRSETALPIAFRGEWLQWMREGDLPIGAETVRQRLSRVRAPVLLVMPLLDRVVHPEHSAPWREVVGETVQIRLLSRLYLHHEDYTHLSILLGRGAPEDVFAPMVRFLEERAR